MFISYTLVVFSSVTIVEHRISIYLPVFVGFQFKIQIRIRAIKYPIFSTTFNLLLAFVRYHIIIDSFVSFFVVVFFFKSEIQLSYRECVSFTINLKCLSKYTFLISFSAFEFSVRFTVVTDFAFTMLGFVFISVMFYVQ